MENEPKVFHGDEEVLIQFGDITVVISNDAAQRLANKLCPIQPKKKYSGWTEKDEVTLTHLYLEEELQSSEIAKKMGISRGAVSNRLTKLGLPNRNLNAQKALIKRHREKKLLTAV